MRTENNHLILGREPFGRVPLYWTSTQQAIWFSTQVQLLIPLLNDPQISLEGLYGYTCFSYVPTPLTTVDQIFSVPAGCELMFPQEQCLHHPQNIRIKNQYQWQENNIKINDEQEAIRQVQVLLKESIHRQIENLSSEPVGVFLSGGIDSATVAALLVQSGVKVRAYTLDFGEEYSPEWPYAQQVAQYLKIPLTKVPATPNRIKKALVETVYALDLPFGDGVTTPLYLLNQAARQDVNIIFNGEGGDQLFAGWTNKPMIAALTYQGFNSSSSQTETNFTQHYLQTFHRLYGYEAQIFQPNLSARINEINPIMGLKDALNPKYCSGLLHRLRRASLMLKGAQNIHPRATNLALSQGLKLRSPDCTLRERLKVRFWSRCTQMYPVGGFSNRAQSPLGQGSVIFPRRNFSQQQLPSLYAGNPKRQTAPPSAEQLLLAFAGITLYHHRDGTTEITPLNGLQKRILSRNADSTIHLCSFPPDLIYSSLLSKIIEPTVGKDTSRLQMC